MGLDWDLLSCRLRGVTGASGRMPEWPCHGLGYGPRATTVAGAGGRGQEASGALCEKSELCQTG